MAEAKFPPLTLHSLCRTKILAKQHKKKCTYIQNSSKKETEVSEDMSKPTMENYLKLMKQNTELHEVVKQSNEIIKQQSGLMQQQMEVSKQQVEVSNKQSGLIQQQMENTEEILDTVKNAKGNTINNNININFFLNDTCKDAMNIADFIDTLKIGMGDLDNFGKGGFIEGVSNVIIKRLNELEVAERPIHCTDLKRKSLYLKDKDTWNKEEPGMNNMKKMIDSVRHKNMMKLPEWQEENPSSRVLSTSKHREYMTIANKVMGGGTDAEDEHNYKSIINKVSGATVLSRNDTVVGTDTCMIVLLLLLTAAAAFCCWLAGSLARFAGCCNTGGVERMPNDRYCACCITLHMLSGCARQP